jgi:ribonucleases P/MRP protein subunit RPP40
VGSSSDLSVTKQVETAAGRGRKVLGFLSRELPKLPANCAAKNYKTVIRPHLEYASSVWTPWLRKEIDALERMQRQATRILLRHRHKNYEERLSDMKITLEARRVRGIRIDTYKILNGHTVINPDELFNRAPREGLRGTRRNCSINKQKTTHGGRLSVFKQRATELTHSPVPHVKLLL